MPQPSDERPLRDSSGAQVDYVVDDQGSRIDLPPDSTVSGTGDPERAIGSTGPSSWWRLGLLILGIIVVVVGVWQIFGRAPGTDGEPNSPTSEPVSEQIAPPGQ